MAIIIAYLTLEEKEGWFVSGAPDWAVELEVRVKFVEKSGTICTQSSSKCSRLRSELTGLFFFPRRKVGVSHSEDSVDNGWQMMTR
jgi:hypothetical protein